MLKAILVGLVAALGAFDYQLGTSYLFRPITLGPLVGLILGDFKTEIIIGANLEMLFMGAISVGAYIPPDVIVGGVLATAFAIQLGEGVEVALALAMPIALLSLSIGNLLDIVNVLSLRIADRGAEKGNSKAIFWDHRLIGIIKICRRFLLTFLAFWLGVDIMQGVLDGIPEFIITGLGAAAGILPAMGFAMLMTMVLKKEIIPFYFIGFVLAAYLEMPIFGVAIIGVSYILVNYGFLKKQPESTVATEGVDDFDGGDDDDF
ncbi:PTS mannose/fructose/sorbose/N-acetylgalactosamine transporter subunit IIC [Miniphocaeibacter halophilus]|uniref:PTS sugar transporter subunit IIC n=1 Tax=Miniphocaeibacter halophilus TaxID=2931922 RepID=A0AC61MT59_9FIRM|nr:PTS sugar transporter subunit IIC [Miniphocaeibacter halophilus]QQK08736.1 PTS sugar transporter subunit IIC [Miniphocaeibacter halophilus]